MSEETSQSSKMEKGAVAMVVVMMCGSFLSALNQNLANTALPTFMQVFGVSMGQVQWLITVYTLANGVMIPVTAYLIERFSTRSMYYWAMSLFVLGTVLCGIAPTFTVLLAGRVVQALGAGISATLMQTVLFTVFPMDKRGTAMGYYSLVIAFAPALGPVLAGFIIDSLPWQALFMVQIPFAALLMIIAAFVMKNVTGGKEGKLDVFSVVLSTIGFGGVLYGFGSVGTLGFANPVVWVSIVVGGIAYGVLAPIMGHVFDHSGPRVLIPAGVAVNAVSLLALCFVGADTSTTYVAIAYAFFEGGMAMCSMQAVTAAINTLPVNLISHGSAMNNTMRQMVSAIATAVFVSLLSTFSNGAVGAAQIPALQNVLVVMFVIAAVLFIWSLFMFRKAH